jgi:ubiquinone/menaquinone biosynthesis C-methylase UbiE
MYKELEPLQDKDLLVLCSAGGEVAFQLAERMEGGKVTGLEIDQELLGKARRLAENKGLEEQVAFQRAENERIPFPDGIFDGLVSEFIVYPTPTPTEIGQSEMARVLKLGGKIVLTDVIVTKSIPQEVRGELEAIGLDYLCDATMDDFQRWMRGAGLSDVKVVDLTPVVRRVWERRQRIDEFSQTRPGYEYLLDDPGYRLGEAVFYIYARGENR